MFRILGKDIISYVEMQSGFNALIKLNKTKHWNEYDFCERLLKYNGLSVLTESCFTISNNKNNFWIRISMAKDKKTFKKSIIMLKKFLKSTNK